MNYSTTGETFLTDLTVPHRKASGHDVWRILTWEPSPPAKIWASINFSNRVVVCNAVELIVLQMLVLHDFWRHHPICVYLQYGNDSMALWFSGGAYLCLCVCDSRGSHLRAVWIPML